MMFCIVRGCWEGRRSEKGGQEASEMRDRQFKNEQGRVAARAGLIEHIETVNGQIAIYLNPYVTRRVHILGGSWVYVFHGLLAMLKMHQMRRQCSSGGWSKLIPIA